MKLTKKIIAAAAALAMTMTSMTGVLADEVIEGDAVHVNKTIYKVTLPTTKGIGFTLDPQGLLTLTGGQGGSSAGTISGTGVMVAYSESSVDVKFSAKFYLDAPSTLSLVDKASTDTSTSSTKEAICMQIKSKKADKAAIATASKEAVSALTDEMDVTGTAIATANAYTTTLQAVDYVITGSAATGFKYIKDPAQDNASFAYLAIGGKVAGEADWSAYANKSKVVKLKAVFGFENAAGDPLSNTYSITTGGKVTLTKARPITSIAYGATDGVYDKTTTAYSYNETTKELTLNSGIFKAGATGSRFFLVTYDNGKTETFSVSLTN